jgi:hypothetical protein
VRVAVAVAVAVPMPCEGNVWASGYRCETNACILVSSTQSVVFVAAGNASKTTARPALQGCGRTVGSRSGRFGVRVAMVVRLGVVMGVRVAHRGGRVGVTVTVTVRVRMSVVRIRALAFHHGTTTLCVGNTHHP